MKEEYPTGSEVSAYEFAQTLYAELERNNLISKSLRDVFIETATDIIYEAMVETGGIGIRR